METQTQASPGWLPLSRSAIEFPETPAALKFLIVQRGSERAGAWVLNGRPIMLVPAGLA
jgi:hypothetical protein